MSSRALRRAQKQRELELGQQEASDDENSDNGPQYSARPSAFDMLGEDGDGQGDKADSDSELSQDDKTEEPVQRTPTTKKKKKKRKTKTPASKPAPSVDNSVDDVDRVLAELSTDSPKDATNQAALKQAAKVLSVDQNHLHVGNEIRRIFGRAASTADAEERAAAREQTSGLVGEGVSLSAVVEGRYAAQGPGLSAVLRRRNIFVEGKEDWPKDTTNGMGMDVLDDRGVEVVYCFTRPETYQKWQATFRRSANSVDVMSMLALLRVAPYHVASLLQVAEIAKQERDFSTAGLLLERALFSFGKSLHPSFKTNVAEGKARLDFRHQPNREFFLAGWRYIANLGMRATWRTAYEWARLLLSLAPTPNPYCVELIIDRLALRAKQPESLIELANAFETQWKFLCNIQYSVALAMHMQGDANAEQHLIETVSHFPWVAARLYQLLDIQRLPPAIWGTKAETAKDQLQCELYVTQSIDLWRVPDALKFLTGAVEKLQLDALEPWNSTYPVNVNETRHVLSLDKPELIGLVPKELTSLLDKTWDPLPPADDVTDAELNAREFRYAQLTPRDRLQHMPDEAVEEIVGLATYLTWLLSNMGLVEVLAEPDGDEEAESARQQLINDTVLREGETMEFAMIDEYRIFRHRSVKFLSIYHALREMPDSRVTTTNGGVLQITSRGGLSYQDGRPALNPPLRLPRSLQRVVRALERAAEQLFDNHNRDERVQRRLAVLEARARELGISEAELAESGQEVPDRREQQELRRHVPGAFVEDDEDDEDDDGAGTD